jgi:hypothetical protein
MLKQVGNSVLYTLANIRYAALILPSGVTAYFYATHPYEWYTIVLAGLLVLAAGAEVALSIANGIEAAKAVRAMDEYAVQQQRDIRSGLDKLNEYANDWTGRGREDSAPEGEDPDEGQDPVPAR